MTRLGQSFAHAFAGFYTAFRIEWKFKIHLAAACVAIILGIYLSLEILEWGFIIFAIGLVIMAELFNTTIERLSDAAAPEKRSRAIKHAKDISAAAVLLSAMTALVIGIILLIIPFINAVTAFF